MYISPASTPPKGEEQTEVTEVTAIIPVYNAANELERCLSSLRAQAYPQDKLHIVVVDDDSTDDTRMVAQRHGATVLRNGYRNIERGKSIGLAYAQSELVLLIDSDNRLPSFDWLWCAVKVLLEHPEVVGAQAARFCYNPKDPPTNRYCSLFGCGDPIAYYLRKVDHLPHLEREWILNGTVVKCDPNYFLVRFTPETMPTVGSQGFLTRKSLLTRTNWIPSLFHVDSNLELVAQGHDVYAILQREVIHDFVRSFAHFSAKLQRNAILFYSQRGIRQHVWTMDRRTLVKSLLKMVTVVVPLREAVSGYLRLRDPAWFIHPVACVYVPLMYGLVYVRWRWKSAWPFVRPAW